MFIFHNQDFEYMIKFRSRTVEQKHALLLKISRIYNRGTSLSWKSLNITTNIKI